MGRRQIISYRYRDIFVYFSTRIVPMVYTDTELQRKRKETKTSQCRIRCGLFDRLPSSISRRCANRVIDDVARIAMSTSPPCQRVWDKNKLGQSAAFVAYENIESSTQFQSHAKSD